LEYGASRPGDIRYPLEIARPYVGVVTAVGDVPSHVEYFSDPEAVIRENARLIEYLPSSGFAVLNSDSDIVMKMQEKTRSKIITFGANKGAEMHFFNLEIRSEGGRPWGIAFKLEYAGTCIPIMIKNVFGMAHGYAVAAATCVGLIFDLNLVEVSDAVSMNYSPLRGRMTLLDGVKGSLIIDDSYDASPLSMEEALRALKELPGKRKIAVLGDMLELGKYAIEAHESVGKLVVGIADILITVGPRGKFIALAAEEEGFPKNKILSFDIAIEAGKAVENLLKTGDLVLVKASMSVDLDKVVDEIKLV